MTDLSPETLLNEALHTKENGDLCMQVAQIIETISDNTWHEWKALFSKNAYTDNMLDMLYGGMVVKSAMLKNADACIKVSNIIDSKQKNFSLNNKNNAILLACDRRSLKPTKELQIAFFVTGGLQGNGRACMKISDAIRGGNYQNDFAIMEELCKRNYPLNPQLAMDFVFMASLDAHPKACTELYPLIENPHQDQFDYYLDLMDDTKMILRGNLDKSEFADKIQDEFTNSYLDYFWKGHAMRDKSMGKKDLLAKGQTLRKHLSANKTKLSIMDKIASHPPSEFIQNAKKEMILNLAV